jgi:1-acyl-sn-glycerol-3-phosphate acyltransferase
MKKVTIDEYRTSFRLYNNLRKKYLRAYFNIYHRLSISGSENIHDGPALIAANHSGGYDLDTLAISTLGSKKREVMVLYWEKYHFLNHWWGRYGVGDSIPVWTAGGIRYEYIDPYLAPSGKNPPGLVCIFPEGRTLLYRERNTLGRFYPGVIRLALHYRIPVIPTAMTGFHKACPVFSANPQKNQPDDPIFFLPFTMPAKLRIIYGKPVTLKKYYDKKILKEDEMRLADELIRQPIAEMLKEYNPKFAV